MSIYAISDLHLSKAIPNKSMEVFGKDWENYEEKLDKNWRNAVKDSDTVIIPGDISWGLTLEEAYEDFAYIDSLPGKKIILKGNHDYYFSTVTKVKKFFMDKNIKTIDILNNNFFTVDGYNICGFRGWGSTDDINVDDHKIYLRELNRLKLSLSSIEEKYRNLPIIVATHFVPFRQEIEQLFIEYNVTTCIYGHLHGDGHYMVKQGNINGVMYKMVSGDYNDFKLVKLD